MKIFITLGDIIAVIFIALIIVGIGILMIIERIQRIGKKNCYECKYYDLYDVSGVGGYCRMKCKKHNKIHNTTDMNEKYHYEKCKDFKGSDKE